MSVEQFPKLCELSSVVALWIILKMTVSDDDYEHILWRRDNLSKCVMQFHGYCRSTASYISHSQKLLPCWDLSTQALIRASLSAWKFDSRENNSGWWTRPGLLLIRNDQTHSIKNYTVEWVRQLLK